MLDKCTDNTTSTVSEPSRYSSNACDPLEQFFCLFTRGLLYMGVDNVMQMTLGKHCHLREPPAFRRKALSHKNIHTKKVSGRFLTV